MTFSKRIEVLISLGNKMLIFVKKGPILNFYQLTGLKLCWWQIQSNLSSNSQNCHHHILSTISGPFSSTTSGPFWAIFAPFLVHFWSILVRKFGQIWPIPFDLVRFPPIFLSKSKSKEFCLRKTCMLNPKFPCLN